MECKDLMVGDLVYIHEPECKGHRIDAIDELDGQVGADGEVYDECDIRPIPLTESILEKNGFVKDGNGDYEINDGIVVVMDWKGKSEHFACAPYEVENCFGQYHYLYVELFECKYVHQLQNLLVIAGVEKEIEL